MSKVLVYGGKGALGSSLMKVIKQRGLYQTINVDIASNDDANFNVVVSPALSFQEQAQFVESEVKKHLNDDKLEAVLCVAGGWAGGNLKSKQLIEATEGMWKASVQTSVISAQIAAQHLKDGGFILLPGAAGASVPSPGMIGYGLAKSAVHHLVRTLAKTKESGLPENTTVVGIMPGTLDTPMNRKSMPNADYSKWTPLEDLSDKILEWVRDSSARPKNGSLVRIKTEEKKTSYAEE